MICPQCQRENLPDSIFCDRCGMRFETVCSHCDEPNRLDARFCRVCGQLIDQTATTAPARVSGVPTPDSYVPKHLAEKILASRQSLEGERKQVTVLFADIRGSTSLLEGLDPEEAQKIIDPVLRVMMDAVHRYEGTVNQVLGDGIMALFGAPLAHEDHAVRACYTALAMQEEMRRYRRKLGQSEESGLQIGIGLNSGEVVVSSISNDLNVDYSALGHTTHMAARMQELAAGGTTLMTASTLRQTEGFVQVKSLGAVQVKGVSRPVEAFEVVTATTARTRVQAAAVRGLTPLVGRRREIEVFGKLMEEAGSGKGQILAIVGEPGLGKSRLVHEFTRHQLRPGWLVLEGASVSYGKATPYFPLIEMLRRYFQIADGEGSEGIQDRVVMHILELDNTFKDAIPPILSLLGALPDEVHPSAPWTQFKELIDATERYLGMDPQQRRRYTFEAIKRVLVRESQRQALLIVFEDLHWIDSETQAFLDSFVESLPMARLVLVVDYRPEYSHSWGDKTYYRQIRVDPLQPASAEELLQYLLGSNKDLAPLKELLMHRTEGNPFFAEESVRSLVETGVLVGEKGAYRPGLRIDEIRIPNTIQNVLADRIDRLPLEEKRLLQIAAVIGVIVPRPLLRAVAELPEDELYACLAKLQSAEFIHETNLFPEVEYSFKHALTNEVAYGALLHDRRTWLHARTVSALEMIAGGNLDDYVETLAHHAFEGELWEKAVFFLRQAGAKATKRFANVETVAFLKRALESLGKLSKNQQNIEQAIDIRLDLRNALFLIGEFESLYNYLREAESLAETLGDQRRLGRVLNFLVSYFGLTGKHDQAIIHGRRALSSNKDCAELNSVSYYYLGQAYHHKGDYHQSIDMLKRTLSLVSAGPDKYEHFGTTSIISVISRVWLVQSLAELGSFRDGISYARDAIHIAEEARQAYCLAYAFCSLGFLLLVKGDFEEAVPALEKAQRICDESEIKVLLTHVGAHLGYTYALLERSEEGLRLLEHSDELSDIIGRKAGQSLRVTWHGQASFLAGQVEEARKYATRALALATQTKERGYEAWALKLLGDVALRNDSTELEQAEKYYNLALGLAKELGMRPLEAHCHVGLGESYVATGKREHANAEFSTARDLYSDMNMTFWLMRAEAALETLAPGREASH